MEIETAAKAFSALGHQPRLEVLRLPVRAGPEGMPAGEIGRVLGMIQNTLSSHLSILSGASLAAPRRDGRSIIYTARFETLGDLLGFMVDECCNGNPELCGPAFGRLASGPASGC